jgi:enamine deaminase RidA (YjgF/YER057c/UK114 family)
MNEPRSSIEHLHSTSRMSKIVRHAGLIYLCGQTSTGSDADGIEAQTNEVLGRIDALLEEAGSHKSRLLSVTIHLKSMDDFAAMNACWEGWLAGHAPPARTTVQALLASPALRVEMTVVAAA